MTETITGLLVNTDGEPERVTIGADHLADFYRLLDTDTVDVVRLPNQCDMWYRDDAAVYDEPVNPVATMQCALLLNNPAFPNIKGSVLFLNVDTSTGESVSLSEDNQGDLAAIACQMFATVLGGVLG